MNRTNSIGSDYTLMEMESQLSGKYYIILLQNSILHWDPQTYVGDKILNETYVACSKSIANFEFL